MCAYLSLYIYNVNVCVGTCVREFLVCVYIYIYIYNVCVYISSLSLNAFVDVYILMLTSINA